MTALVRARAAPSRAPGQPSLERSQPRRPGLQAAAHAGGAGRPGAARLPGVRAVERRPAGDQQVRPRLRHHQRLGSGGRAVRRLSADLRHPGLVADRSADRGAALARRGHLPHRVRAQVGAAAGRLPDRPAGRDPQRGVRAVGHLRPDPARSGRPSSRSSATLFGFLPFFQGPDLRPVDAGGRDHPGDHGHALRHVGRPGRCCWRCPTPSGRPRSRSAPPGGRR